MPFAQKNIFKFRILLNDLTALLEEKSPKGLPFSLYINQFQQLVPRIQSPCVNYLV